MGKLTISMAIFNSFLYVYQRVSIWRVERTYKKKHRNLDTSRIQGTSKHGEHAQIRMDGPPTFLCENVWKLVALDTDLDNKSTTSWDDWFLLARKTNVP